MKERQAGVTLVSLLSLTVTCVSGRYEFVHPLGFFNTSVQGNVANNIGFVSMFVCSSTSRQANVLLAFNDASLNNFTTVGQFDKTYDYGQAIFSSPNKTVGNQDLPLGIDISGDSPIFVYGVQSDTGSTDGFLATDLTVNSTEFYIAGWKGEISDSGILIAAAFPGTCVEIYQITNGTKYSRIRNIYLLDDKWISQVVWSNDNDTTGLYLNSTKPINVFASVTCGSVPNMGTRFCDYMVEHIPPVSELGTLHIVPVIAGRSPSGGYIVRVVATEPDTTISWMNKAPSSITVTGPSAIPAGSTQATITRSQYLQFDVKGSTYLPLMVNCSRKCVVMQYNKGYRAVTNEIVRTDPFMMLTVAVDHFVNNSCFRTATAAQGKYANNVVVGYDELQLVNYVSIVTRTADKGSILLNGSVVTSSAWLPDAIGDYSVGYVSIVDGWYSITTTGGATFAAYVYGHGPTSSAELVGYGYPVAYRLLSPVVNGYKPEDTSVVTTASPEGPASTEYCQATQVTTGTAVVSNSDAVVSFPIELRTSIIVNNSLPLTSRCVSSYTTALQQLIQSVYMEVNTKICTHALCPYLSNTTNPGVLISPSGVTPVYVFVAIDATQVSNSVKLITSSAGMITDVQLEMPFYGFYNTSVESFKNCRMEVREHLSSLVNWLTPGSGLTEQHPIATPPACPELTFYPNMTTAKSVCDVWTGP